MKRMLPFIAVLVAVFVGTTGFAIAYRLGKLPIGAADAEALAETPEVGT